MTRTNLPLLLVCALGSTALAAPSNDGAAAGADWPQWRGPERTGVSVEASWSPEGKTEALWTKELGLGHSSFAVANGRVYTLGYDAEAKLDSVYCFDAATGDEIWRHRYEAEIWDVAHDGGTITTPTVVGDVVYTSNREGKAFCLDAATGDVRWTRDLRADMELEPHTWGFSASPLVVDGMVVLNLGHVVALEAGTGEEVWVTEKGYGFAYSTPTAFELDGRAYLAVLDGDGLVVLDRTDGAEVAFHEWVKEPQIYPMSPVVVGDRIFISAGYDRGCAMLQFTGDALTELWASRVMRNKMSGCVLWNDHLFGFDESILKCIGLDGKERWRERGMGTGSMSIAGGRLLILDGRGNIIVAEANPEEYVELSRQPVLDGGTGWATPVLSHGRVYCRSSLGQMACLDYSGAGTAGTMAAAAVRKGAEALPAADAIVARHVEAVRGRDARERVTSVRMTGTSESLINTVRTGTIELVWDAERGFRWSDESGFDFGYNADVGWMMTPNSPPAVLDGADLTALQRAGNVERFFDPAVGFTSMQTIALTTFEGRECYELRAMTPEGLERSLYFEVASGLYAGHEGEGIAMWTLDGYRDFDGVMLPTQWSTFESINGERVSAAFDSVTINPEPDAERFATPAAIRPFLRTPEEIERDGARLRELHAGILGEWRSEEDASDDPPVRFEVQEGFLVLLRAEREPARLSEPDENGRMTLLAADYVSFTPERDDAGELAAIAIRVGDEPRDRLVRAR